MNSNIKIIKVTTKEQLETLRSKSIFTWEGMSEDEDNLEQIYNALKSEGFKQEQMTIYIFKGKLMNLAYDLIGDTRYKDDLTFVSIADYYNPIVKIKFGARWLDDIIDNNLRMNEQ